MVDVGGGWSRSFAAVTQSDMSPIISLPLTSPQYSLVTVDHSLFANTVMLQRIRKVSMKLGLWEWCPLVVPCLVVQLHWFWSFWSIIFCFFFAVSEPSASGVEISSNQLENLLPQLEDLELHSHCTSYSTTSNRGSIFLIPDFPLPSF